jgi:hypothetical protein
MTYKELLEKLSAMSDTELALTATVWVSDDDEFFAVRYMDNQDEDDVLDADHPFMVI